MNMFASLAFLGVAFLSFPLSAAESEPAEMMRYRGNPIDALCVAQLLPWEVSDEVSTVNLKDCGSRAMKITLLENISSSYFADHGFVGVDYMENDGGRASYAYYKDLGDADGARLLWLERSGGGSGSFSNIVMVSREDDVLTLQQSLLSGDRCNNGIVNATLRDGTLTTEQNITPIDLLELADGNARHLKAYEGLEAGATSCIGTVERIDGKNFARVKLSEQDMAFTDVEGKTERYTYQSCFNTIMQGYIKEGNATLNKTGLKKFANRFYSRCLKPVKKESKKAEPAKTPAKE